MLLLGDYTEIVLTAYEERDPNQLPLLTHLTTANIKKECLNVYTERFEKDGKEEEYTLRLFFGVPSSGKNFGYMIRKCSADRFRSLQSFLRRETRSPGLANVELLAWLIDFTPRPLARAQSQLEKLNGTIRAVIPATDVNATESKPDSDLSKSEGSKEFVSTASVLNSDVSSESWGNDLSAKPDEESSPSTNTGKGWRDKVKKVAAVISIAATTLAGTYFVIWPAGKSKTDELKSPNTIVGDSSAIKVAEPDKKDSKTVIPIKMDKQIVRCQAITKKGTQCKRVAESNGYCWQHKKK
jgi:hypothetical protein